MLNCTVRGAHVYLSVRHAVRTRNRVSGDYRTHYRYPPPGTMHYDVSACSWDTNDISPSRPITKYIHTKVLDHFVTKLLSNKEDFVQSNQSLAYHFRSNSISCLLPTLLENLKVHKVEYTGTIYETWHGRIGNSRIRKAARKSWASISPVFG